MRMDLTPRNCRSMRGQCEGPLLVGSRKFKLRDYLRRDRLAESGPLSRCWAARHDGQGERERDCVFGFHFGFLPFWVNRTPRPSALNSTPPFSNAVFIARRFPACIFSGISSRRSTFRIEPGESPHSLASLSADHRKIPRAARICVPVIIPHNRWQQHWRGAAYRPGQHRGKVDRDRA